MDNERILQLALEALQVRRTSIEAQIQELSAESHGQAAKTAKGAGTAVPPGKRRTRTAAERQAQSRAMKLYWRRKRAKAAKAQTAKKPAQKKPKRGPQSAAAREALSQKMKLVWAKRKAEAAKTSKG